jgi:hypothetical protein
LTARLRLQRAWRDHPFSKSGDRKAFLDNKKGRASNRARRVAVKLMGERQGSDKGLENGRRERRIVRRRGWEMEGESAAAHRRKWNWRIWVGFLMALAALPCYVLIFLWHPITRNVPWVTWLMFVVAGWLLWTGVRKAFASPQEYRGKIFGSVLGVLALAIASLFGCGTLYLSRQLPASGRAPNIGDQAPEFTLADTSGKMVTLASLLMEPIPGGAKPRGVVLIFYRGYW